MCDICIWLCICTTCMDESQTVQNRTECVPEWTQWGGRLGMWHILCVLAIHPQVEQIEWCDFCMPHCYLNRRGPDIVPFPQQLHIEFYSSSVIAFTRRPVHRTPLKHWASMRTTWRCLHCKTEWNNHNVYWLGMLITWAYTFVITSQQLIHV